jgi:para-nitrobenzyl esterase
LPLLRFLVLCFWLGCAAPLAAAPASGQWYDRARPGHGLDLNRAAGTLFGTLYTYDANGEPEWLWIELPDADVLQGELTRFRRQGGVLATERAGSFALQPANACADGIARPGVSALYRFDFELGGAPQSWCVEALLPAAAAAQSVLDGQWFVPGDDGWGIVVHYYPRGDSSTETFQVIYFHDAAGAPRWAFAQGAADSLVQLLEFGTLRVACAGCAADELSYRKIGEAQVGLRSSNAGAQGNRITVALQFDAGAPFQRDVALTLLSAPRAVDGAASTRQGPVAGAVDEGIARFFAIPFTTPPLATLRFRAPQPPALRDVVRDARALGPGCIQPTGLSPFGSEPATQSEDCLQLNVWRPEGPGPFPVMVWIHGGGSIMGSAVGEVAGRLTYDGAAYAREGVVFVSINYRLNAFGFLAMRELVGGAPEQPGAGNYGLLDQVAALAWVRDNIAAFGGDPGNVTIFGESAGGVSACNLIASPRTAGLFAQAIMQSGNCLRNPPDELAAFAQGDRVVAAAGCANAPAGVVECMRALEALVLLGAAAPTIAIGFPSSGESYGAFVDGFALPDAPAAAIVAGTAAQVPFILGVNDDETTTLIPPSMLPQTAEQYEALIRGRFPLVGNALLAQYPVAAYPTPARAYQDIVDDLAFACAARRAAADHAGRGNAVWHYALTEIFPEQPALESFHGMDIALLFGPRPAADAAEIALGEAMRSAWVRFAKTGDPQAVGGTAWPRYDGARQSVALDGGGNSVVDDYRRPYCEFWAQFVAL